jgi:hypothetical protein
MRKNILSESELKQRMKQLANISEAKHDSSPKVSGIIKDVKECKDGYSYAIIKESQKYFIKKSKQKGKATLSEQFDYIGGVQDFLIEAHDSYQKAYDRFNTKINELNKKIDKLIIDNKLTHGKEQSSNEEYEKNISKGLEEDEKDDIDLEKLKVVNNSKPKNNPQSAQPVATPSSDLPTIATPSSDLPPVAGSNNKMTSLPNNTPSNDSELPSFEETPEATPEPTAEPTAEPSPEEMENSEDEEDTEDEGDDLEKEVYRLMGKLGDKLRKLGNDLDTDTAKNLLGQMITGTKEGLKKMEDSDVKKIAKKIEKRGEKTTDNTDDSSDEDMEDELPSDDSQETPQKGSQEPLKKNIKNKTNDSDLEEANDKFANVSTDSMLALKETYIIKGLIKNIKKMILNEDINSELLAKSQNNKLKGITKPLKVSNVSSNYSNRQFTNGLFIKEIDGTPVVMEKVPMSINSNISSSEVGINDDKQTFNIFNGNIKFNTNNTNGSNFNKYINIIFNYEFIDDDGNIIINKKTTNQNYLKIYGGLLDNCDPNFIIKLKELIKNIIIKEAKKKFNGKNIIFEINNSDIKIIKKTKDDNSDEPINDIGDEYNTSVEKIESFTNFNSIKIRNLENGILYMKKKPLLFNIRQSFTPKRDDQDNDIKTNIFKPDEMIEGIGSIIGNARYITNLQDEDISKYIDVMFKFNYLLDDNLDLKINLNLSNRDNTNNFIKVFTKVLDIEYKDTFVKSFIKYFGNDLLDKINQEFNEIVNDIKFVGRIDPQYVNIIDNDNITGSDLDKIEPIEKRVNPYNMVLPPRPKQKAVNKLNTTTVVNNKTKTDNNSKNSTNANKTTGANSNQKFIAATKAYPKLPNLREDFNNINLQNLVKEVVNEEINKFKTKKKI